MAEFMGPVEIVVEEDGKSAGVKTEQDFMERYCPEFAAVGITLRDFMRCADPDMRENVSEKLRQCGIELNPDEIKPRDKEAEIAKMTPAQREELFRIEAENDRMEKEIARMARKTASMKAQLAQRENEVSNKEFEKNKAVNENNVESPAVENLAAPKNKDVPMENFPMEKIDFNFRSEVEGILLEASEGLSTAGVHHLVDSFSETLLEVERNISRKKMNPSSSDVKHHLVNAIHKYTREAKVLTEANKKLTESKNAMHRSIGGGRTDSGPSDKIYGDKKSGAGNESSGGISTDVLYEEMMSTQFIGGKSQMQPLPEDRENSPPPRMARSYEEWCLMNGKSMNSKGKGKGKGTGIIEGGKGSAKGKCKGKDTAYQKESAFVHNASAVLQDISAGKRDIATVDIDASKTVPAHVQAAMVGKDDETMSKKERREMKKLAQKQLKKDRKAGKITVEEQLTYQNILNQGPPKSQKAQDGPPPLMGASCSRPVKSAPPKPASKPAASSSAAGSSRPALSRSSGSSYAPACATSAPPSQPAASSSSAPSMGPSSSRRTVKPKVSHAPKVSQMDTSAPASLQPQAQTSTHSPDQEAANVAKINVPKFDAKGNKILTGKLGSDAFAAAAARSCVAKNSIFTDISSSDEKITTHTKLVDAAKNDVSQSASYTQPAASSSPEPSNAQPRQVQNDPAKPAQSQSQKAEAREVEMARAETETSFAEMQSANTGLTREEYHECGGVDWEKVRQAKRQHSALPAVGRFQCIQSEFNERMQVYTNRFHTIQYMLQRRDFKRGFEASVDEGTFAVVRAVVNMGRVMLALHQLIFYLRIGEKSIMHGHTDPTISESTVLLPPELDFINHHARELRDEFLDTLVMFTLEQIWIIELWIKRELHNQMLHGFLTEREMDRLFEEFDEIHEKIKLHTKRCHARSDVDVDVVDLDYVARRDDEEIKFPADLTLFLAGRVISFPLGRNPHVSDDRYVFQHIPMLQFINTHVDYSSDLVKVEQPASRDILDDEFEGHPCKVRYMDCKQMHEDYVAELVYNGLKQIEESTFTHWYASQPDLASSLLEIPVIDCAPRVMDGIAPVNLLGQQSIARADEALAKYTPMELVKSNGKIRGKVRSNPTLKQFMRPNEPKPDDVPVGNTNFIVFTGDAPNLLDWPEFTEDGLFLRGTVVRDDTDSEPSGLSEMDDEEDQSLFGSEEFESEIDFQSGEDGDEVPRDDRGGHEDQQDERGRSEGTARKDGGDGDGGNEDDGDDQNGDNGDDKNNKNNDKDKKKGQKKMLKSDDGGEDDEDDDGASDGLEHLSEAALCQVDAMDVGTDSQDDEAPSDPLEDERGQSSEDDYPPGIRRRDPSSEKTNEDALSESTDAFIERMASDPSNWDHGPDPPIPSDLDEAPPPDISPVEKRVTYKAKALREKDLEPKKKDEDGNAGTLDGCEKKLHDGGAVAKAAGVDVSRIPRPQPPGSSFTQPSSSSSIQPASSSVTAPARKSVPATKSLPAASTASGSKRDLPEQSKQSAPPATRPSARPPAKMFLKPDTSPPAKMLPLSGDTPSQEDSDEVHAQMQLRKDTEDCELIISQMEDCINEMPEGSKLASLTEQHLKDRKGFIRFANKSADVQKFMTNYFKGTNVGFQEKYNEMIKEVQGAFHEQAKVALHDAMKDAFQDAISEQIKTFVKKGDFSVSLKIEPTNGNNYELEPSDDEKIDFSDLSAQPVMSTFKVSASKSRSAPGAAAAPAERKSAASTFSRPKTSSKPSSKAPSKASSKEDIIKRKFDDSEDEYDCVPRIQNSSIFSSTFCLNSSSPFIQPFICVPKNQVASGPYGEGWYFGELGLTYQLPKTIYSTTASGSDHVEPVIFKRNTIIHVMFVDKLTLSTTIQNEEGRKHTLRKEELELPLYCPEDGAIINKPEWTPPENRETLPKGSPRSSDGNACGSEGVTEIQKLTKAQKRRMKRERKQKQDAARRQEGERAARSPQSPLFSSGCDIASP